MCFRFCEDETPTWILPLYPVEGLTSPKPTHLRSSKIALKILAFLHLTTQVNSLNPPMTLCCRAMLGLCVRSRFGM